LHKLLRFLASLKLAIYLLAAMVGLYAVAAFHGDTDIYGSWMFRVLLGAFWINLFTCTIMHLPIIWRIISKKVQNDFAGHGYEEIPHSQDLSAEEINVKLKKIGLKADTLFGDEGINIFAQKGRLSLVAPQLLHISILLILIGAFFTSFSVSGAIICTDGQKAALPKAVAERAGDGYEIYVESFQTVYDQDGAVDNWVTTLELRHNGEAVKAGTVSVNHPLKYKGISIYQNSYKYQYLIGLEGISPEVDGAYSLPEDLEVCVNDDLCLAAHGMGGEQVLLYTRYKGEEVTYALDFNETMLFHEDIKISYWGENNYTILQIKHAVGTNVVFAGFILAAIASMLFYCGRYREISLRKRKGENWQYKLYCKSPEIARKMKSDFLSE